MDHRKSGREINPNALSDIYIYIDQGRNLTDIGLLDTDVSVAGRVASPISLTGEPMPPDGLPASPVIHDLYMCMKTNLVS